MQINAAEPKLQSQTRSEAVYKILVLSWHRGRHKGMIYETVKAQIHREYSSLWTFRRLRCSRKIKPCVSGSGTNVLIHT